MIEKTKFHEPLPFATQRLFHALLTGLLVLGMVVGFVLLRGNAMLMLAFAWSLFGAIPGRPTLIAAAPDGLLLRWWGREELVPMRRLRDVKPFGARFVTLGLDRDVRFLRVAVASNRIFFGGSRDRDAWLDRVRTALAAFRVRVPATQHVATLGQGERTHAAWLEALRVLRDGDAGYRDAAIPVDELWKVVEDPGSPADVRAGAALVLRGSLDAAGKERVRVAASKTASPKLRVALACASEESEDELQAALQHLEPRRARGA